MTEANGTSQQQLSKLAALLRDCATYVERNEFHPDLYQALGGLHAYAGEHSNNPNYGEDRQLSPKTSGSFDQQHASAQHLIGSLGKKFTKGLGLAPTTATTSTSSTGHQSHAHSSAAKNAERVRADLEAFRRSGQPKAEVGHRSKENDWCDEHFCLGCQCKSHLKSATITTSTAAEPSLRASSSSPTPRETPRVVHTMTTTATPASSSSTSRPSKPAFQRPINPNSILIANGWIEQQRRSKMRVVWKDVLASLVEGRKPGEETTLWIQREITNPISGKAELEALHQIPMKWLTGIEYLNYSTDHRFALKVYNVPEEFLFRCADAEAAQNWVLALRSVREISLQNNGKKATTTTTATGNKPTSEASNETTTTKQETSQEKAPSSSVEQQPSSSSTHRMTISELRAIAHGAGISTVGMERRELEEAVANIAGGAQSDTQKEEAARAHEEEVRKRREAAMEEQRRRGQAAAAEEEKRRKQQALEEAQRMMEETERRNRAAAEEAERRVRAEEEALRRRKLAEEEQRMRQLAEEEQRRRQMAEEERRRKLAEEELLRRKLAEEEQIRRQQAAEEEARRRKLAEEEQRRRAAAEQQAAEQRRRREEAQRQHWQQQQQQQQWQQRQQPQSQQQWQQPQQPQQQWQQQQQQRPGQQPYFGGRAASPPGHVPPPPQGTGAPSSPVNLKYAKMAAQDDDNGQAAITAIKHKILVHWALQPPLLQMLRPIDVLVSTIHNVFPPAFGVPGHEYFTKWKAVHREALLGPGLRPDEEKLKKSVRKLRFFLHPDKLPRDLNEEQQFMCKMLWDVTSDAWEEFEKHKEELDWIRG